MRAHAILPIVALALATHAFGADKPCTKPDAANAQKALDRAVTWPALEIAVRDFGHCDNGELSEQFTEPLLRMLVSDWRNIGVAVPIFDRNAAFKKWMLDRLGGEKVAKDDKDDVRGLAKNSCPAGRNALCAQILEALGGTTASSDAPSFAPLPMLPVPGAAPAAPAKPSKP